MIIEALQNEILARKLPFNKFEWVDLKHGATNCVYARVYNQDGRIYFLKAGEKVGREVDNLQFLQVNNIDFVPRLEEGASSRNNILVTEYLESPNYGLDMLNALYQKDVESGNFIEFQRRTFDAISSFYNIPINLSSSFKSKMLSIRAEERLNLIRADKTPLVISEQDGQVDLKDILDIPIVYLEGGREKVLPSISDMLIKVRKYEDLLPQLSPRVIHGDFHAPNVALGKDGLIKFVDLSDIRYGEDPSWDLGKWLNYLKRFHPVVRERIVGESRNNTSISVEDSLNIIDTNNTNNDFSAMQKDAVNYMGGLLGEDPDILAKRSSIAEWVVNISTIRRHTKVFPYTSTQILSCICSSYIDIFNN